MKNNSSYPIYMYWINLFTEQLLPMEIFGEKFSYPVLGYLSVKRPELGILLDYTALSKPAPTLITKCFCSIFGKGCVCNTLLAVWAESFKWCEMLGVCTWVPRGSRSPSPTPTFRLLGTGRTCYFVTWKLKQEAWGFGCWDCDFPSSISDWG